MVRDAASATFRSPASLFCVFGTDIDTLAVSEDSNANFGLCSEEAGLRSDTAIRVAEADDEAADARLESVFADALVDLRFWWSVRLKRFNWTSGGDESEDSSAESSTFPFKWTVCAEAIFDKACLIAFHNPWSQGSTTNSSLETVKSTR